MLHVAHSKIAAILFTNFSLVTGRLKNGGHTLVDFSGFEALKCNRDASKLTALAIYLTITDFASRQFHPGIIGQIDDIGAGKLRGFCSRSLSGGGVVTSGQEHTYQQNRDHSHLNFP
ncbi:hypothetical protein CO724_16530 [Ectopseudomonas mendocina]|nr:hypothetical protein CO724_16530 [Pseudomonas mendocina]